MSETTAPETRRDLLRDLVHQADSFDISWSFSDGRTQRRYLLFFDHVDARVDALARVAAHCGMTQTSLQHWHAGLAGADAMGIALDDGATSVRLYSQYWDQLLAQMRDGDASPRRLYRGVKSLGAATSRVDDYICTPKAPRTVFWPQIAQGLKGLGMDADKMADALAPLSAQNCIYTQTDGAGRQAWLATVRNAEIDPQKWRTALASLPASDAVKDLRQHAAHSELLHLAGGIDDTKGAFCTIYHTASPAQVLALI